MHRSTEAHGSPGAIDLRASIPPGKHTTWLYCALVLGTVATAYHSNTVVLTDGVYRALLAAEGGSARTEEVLALTRRWALFGYLMVPLWLGVKIGVVALLVQLGLLSFRLKPPLRRVFAAGVWAEFALLFGSLVRTLWLGSLPQAARTLERLERVPGSGEWLLSGLGPFPPSIGALLQQVSVYQIGWGLVYVLALEDGTRLRLRPALVVISGVWIGSILTRWGLALYLGLSGAG